MANIEKETQCFREAIYGEEVRGSMISLAEKLNAEGEQVVSAVSEAIEKAETTMLTAQEAVTEAERATREANAASDEAKQINQQSEENVTAARSWAIGETGTRDSEDTDNSKYYSQLSAEQAERSQIEADASKAEADRSETEANRAKAEADRASTIVGAGIATDEDAGFIKGNPDEFLIDSEGKLSLTSTFSEQDALTEITGTENKKTLFGKLAKGVSDLINHIGDTARHFTLTNNLLATVAGTALDAAQGKVLDDKLKFVIEAADYIYDGVDLTVKFAEEIAGFPNVWLWVKARIEAANFDGLHVGDYIPMYMETYLIKMQIAGMDTYHNCTDQKLGHHIDWISKDCYPDTVQWFTASDNNGTSTDAYPYNKSTVKSFLGTLENKLPTEVREVISSKRFLLEQRYSSSGKLTDSTAWGWADLGKLWIPSEYEVFGSCVWSTAPWGAGQALQYPVFANDSKNRIKRAGTGGDRTAWFLLSVCSGFSTHISFVHSYGCVFYVKCTNAYRVPVCFRISE